MFGSGLPGIVGVNACGSEERFMALGHADTGFQIRRTLAGSDRDHAFDAGVQSPANHFFAIGIEFLAVEVAVRVNQHVRWPGPALLQASADWYVFEKAGQNWFAALR